MYLSHKKALSVAIVVPQQMSVVKAWNAVLHAGCVLLSEHLSRSNREPGEIAGLSLCCNCSTTAGTIGN